MTKQPIPETSPDYDRTRLVERPDGFYCKEEAEAEIGVAGWVDPETGEPAEEERPRMEDR